MKIIALLGKSRVGKDTAAAILSDVFGYPIARLATPVKDAVHALFDIPRDRLETFEKELADPRYEKTPRDLMVWLTSQLRRDFSQDFFFKRMMMNYPPISTAGIIIPDVRFPEDVLMLREHGALIIKITRGHAPVVHHHEEAIDTLSGHLLLENNGTLEEYEEAVHRLSNYLKRGPLRDRIFGRQC